MEGGGADLSAYSEHSRGSAQDGQGPPERGQGWSAEHDRAIRGSGRLLPCSVGPFKLLQCFDGDDPGVEMRADDVEVIDSFSFDPGYRVHELHTR